MDRLLSHTVIFLIFFMYLTCADCGKQCLNKRGLTVHRLRCKKLNENIATGVQELRTASTGNKRSQNSSLPAKIPRLEDTDTERERDWLRLALGDEFDPVARQPSPESALQSREPIPFIELPPTRSGRVRKAPRAFQDFVPSVQARDTLHETLARLAPSVPEPVTAPDVSEVIQEDPPSTHVPPEQVQYQTQPNAFGMFRRYPRLPKRDPDDEEDHDNHVDSETIAPPPNSPDDSHLTNTTHWISNTLAAGFRNWFYPFLNATVFRIMHWFYTGSNLKSRAELDRLVNKVILAPDFNPENLRDFSVAREEQRLDESSLDEERLRASGWKQVSVVISLPKEKVRHASEDDAPKLTVDGIWMRSIVDIVKTFCKDRISKNLNFVPFESYFRDENGKEERIFSEVYDSQAMLDEDSRIQAMPRNPKDSDDVEYAVFPIIAYSDATLLANFGSASLWPIYLYFPLLSKYIRNKPSSFSAHHLAYVPSLPDTVQDTYEQNFGRAASKEVLRMLKIQLMHAIWLCLLDDRFVEAYKNGLLVLCGDGCLRRIFIRIFIYSCDYPEKFLARCLCPRCYITKDRVHEMGSKRDLQRRKKLRVDCPEIVNLIHEARARIFKRGYAVKGDAVEALLQQWSLVPVQSAFSIRLGPLGFNHYSMFAGDVMHEFELGVWKAVFKQILRLIYALGSDGIQKLNKRFRTVPTFGDGTIRRFRKNISGAKRLAARDYEDILQCIIPCLEGLFPEDLEPVVMDMLWYLCFWHALVKLRLHSESTIALLDAASTHLGKVVRRFCRKTAHIATKELPTDEAARTRRKARLIDKGADAATLAKLEKKRVKLNLFTYKWHYIAHYPHDILAYGPTDNYCTCVGECEHKVLKKIWNVTNKRAVEGQIAHKQDRHRKLSKIKEKDEGWKQVHALATSQDQAEKKRGRPRKLRYFTFKPEDAEDLPQADFNAHHQMSESRAFRTDLSDLIANARDDAALVNFIPKLKNHLLARLRGLDFDGDEYTFSDSDRRQVRFVNNRIYRHQTMRVNYTTYDMRRDQDTINPRTRPDIMLIAPDETDASEDEKHPYWYARVCAIFHAYILYTGPGPQSPDPQKIEFLWVRWLGRDLQTKGGFETNRLHRVGFIEITDDAPFGFLDPARVVRGVHLIPGYHHGRITDLLPGRSVARGSREEETDDDWRFLYVNIFADRDMLIRYLGGGIGHVNLRGIVKIQEASRYILDRTRFAELFSEAEAIVYYGETQTSDGNEVQDAQEEDTEDLIYELEIDTDKLNGSEDETEDTDQDSDTEGEEGEDDNGDEIDADDEGED